MGRGSVVRVLLLFDLVQSRGVELTFLAQHLAGVTTQLVLACEVCVLRGHLSGAVLDDKLSELLVRHLP